MGITLTRRTFIGMSLVTLAAVTTRIAFRRMQRDLPAGRRDIGPYDRFDIPHTQVNSNLPYDDVQAAFESLLSARERWVKFRGISGKATVSRLQSSSAADSPIKLDHDVFLELRLHPDGGELRGASGTKAFKADLSCSNQPDGSRLWRYTWDSSSNARRLEGEQVAGLEASVLTQLLVAPFQLFTGLHNEALEGLIPYWMVSIGSPIVAGSCMYCFASNGKATEDGVLAPSISLVNGDVTLFLSKHAENQPFAVLEMSSFAKDSEMRYPRRIESHFDLNNGAPLSHDVRYRIEFSSIDSLVSA